MNCRVRATALSAALGLFALFATMSPRVAAAQRPVARVAIAARSIARGTTISIDDIIYKDSTVRAAGDSTRVTAGWVARRLIVAGEVLRAPAVEPPNAVVANQAIDVEWRDQNVALTIRGIATRSAALGDRVTVRTDSGHRVEGVVVGPGRVRID